MGDFKKAFNKYMQYQHRNIKCTLDEKNHAPFTELGYRVVDANWCKACGKEAAGGAQRCCPAYRNANRTHHTRILGMEIVQLRPTNQDGSVSMWVSPEAVSATSSLSERAFCAGLQAATGLTFETGVRPAWLRNPETGHPMELDMYNAAERLAVEYDGPHHYEYPNMYHRTQAEFDAQRGRDEAKTVACARHGTRLLRVRACAGIDTEGEVAACVEELRVLSAV